MKHIATAFLALCTGLATAVPLRFEADVTKAATYTATAYRGETLEIEAALTDRGTALTNSAPAAMFWQTNGMDTAWWTAPAVMTGGVVRAVWSPTNDVGASSYRIFLGVTDGGLNYRANLTLRMTGSPGDAPNALPLPTHVLDFAAVSVTNADASPFVTSVNGRPGAVVLYGEDILVGPFGQTINSGLNQLAGGLMTHIDDTGNPHGVTAAQVETDNGDTVEERFINDEQAIQDVQDAVDGKQGKITVSGILKGNGAGGVSKAVAGTDYAAASHSHSAGNITNGILNSAFLPNATTSAKGGMIVGDGLSVSNAKVSVTPATTSAIGGVIPDGTTITVDATGKISAQGGGGGMTAVAQTVTATGNPPNKNYEINCNADIVYATITYAGMGRINFALPALDAGTAKTVLVCFPGALGGSWGGGPRVTVNGTDISYRISQYGTSISSSESQLPSSWGAGGYNTRITWWNIGGVYGAYIEG